MGMAQECDTIQEKVRFFHFLIRSRYSSFSIAHGCRGSGVVMVDRGFYRSTFFRHDGRYQKWYQIFDYYLFQCLWPGFSDEIQCDLMKECRWWWWLLAVLFNYYSLRCLRGLLSTYGRLSPGVFWVEGSKRIPRGFERILYKMWCLYLNHTFSFSSRAVTKRTAQCFNGVHAWSLGPVSVSLVSPHRGVHPDCSATK